MPFFVSPIVALVVLVPLLACIVCVLEALSVKVPASGSKRAPKSASAGLGASDASWSVRAAVFGSGGALVAAVVSLARLFADPASFGYFQLLRCLRVGMIDASLSLSLDPLRAIAASAVAGGATFAAVRDAKTSKPRAHAELLVMLTGAELVIASDGALGIVIGLFVLGAGALIDRAATGAASNVALLRASGASAAIVLFASVVLAWGVAGTWTGGDYVGELFPRFSAAKHAKPSPDAPKESKDKKKNPKEDSKKKGAVSMASMGGAFIYLDDSRAPWEVDEKIVHPPFFDMPIAAGKHTFRFHLGYGNDDYVISHLEILEGQNITILPVGSTLSARELRAQFEDLDDSTDDWPLPNHASFADSRVFGLGAAKFAEWLMVLASAILAFASLAWGRGPVSRSARARSLAVLACAATLSYRVSFLGYVPLAAWLGLLALAAGLGFFASRSEHAEASLAARVWTSLRRVAEAIVAFDGRIVDAPFRAVAFVRRAKPPVVAGLVFFLITLGGLVFPSICHSAEQPGGRIKLSAQNGSRGPLILQQKMNDAVGEFEIQNTGDRLLTITRVTIRTDVHDVRAPGALTVKSEQILPLNLPPGGKDKVIVTLGHNGRVQEVYAHVLVASSDETASEVAMGVVGHLPSRTNEPLGLTIASSLILLLVIGAVVVFGLGAMGISWSGRGAVGLAVIALAAVGLLISRFDPGPTRADGNDGLSFIERSPLSPSLGSEMFLAVDGLALIIVACIVFVLFIAFATTENERGSLFEKPFLLLGCACGVGAAFARDLLLFTLFFAGAAIFLTLVVRASSKAMSISFGKMRAIVFVALAATALVVFAIHDASDRVLLIDGTYAPHGFSIPELSRVEWAQKSATLFGAHLTKSGYVALVLAFAAIAGVPPFHTFTLDVFSESARPTGIIALGIVRALAFYALVHVVLGVLPDSCRWGAGGVAWLGAIGAAYSAICALAEKRLGRKLGYLVSMQASVALFSFASVSPQGTSGVLFGALSIMISSAAVALLPARGVALESAASDVALLDPRARASAALALLACAAMPAFPGFYGLFSAAIGGIARNPAPSLLLVLAVACTLATVGTNVAALVSARASSPSAVAPNVHPAHGWAEYALLVAILATGIFPATCLDLAATSIRDRTSDANPPGATEIATR